MKVILLDNIRGVGQVGDVKDVSDGYARNFLLPRGKAKPATQGAMKDVIVLKGKRLAEIAVAKTAAEAAAKTLEGTVVEIAGKANEKGTLFAAITATDIAVAVSTKTGIHVTEAQVVLPEPLKSTGEHPITLELTDGVTAQVTVTVTSK